MNSRAIALALCFLSNSLFSAGSIDLMEARRCFSEAKALSDRDGGRLWGKPLYGPMLFVDPASRTLVANEPDGEHRLQAEGGLFVGKLPQGIGIANTAVEWAGRTWTMLMWPLPEDGEARAMLLMHECFHRLQPGLPSGRGGGLPAGHLATLEGRIWLRLEWRALGAALLLRDKARKQAMLDALLFRAKRRSLFKDAGAAESSLELNEGLAEYTGVIAGSYSPTGALATTILRLRTGWARESYPRNFANATGPAYGLLLDSYRGKWRRELTATSDLGNMLGRAVWSRDPIATLEEAWRRAEVYAGQILREDETRAERTLSAQTARLKATYSDGPTLFLAGSSAANYTFDPRNAVPLDGLGTVYGSGSASDEWGRLEAPGGLLVIHGTNQIKGFQVPAPTDPATAAGAGWSLKVNPGWGLRPGARTGDWVVGRVP